MNTPLVTVIIPTFNSAKSIRLCVDSVLAQTVTDIEVLVIDDCSSDDTVEIIESKYLDPRVILIKNERNLGPGGSRNVGLKRSRGKYIAFLDSDDSWMPEKLEMQLPAFDDPLVGAVTCQGIRTDDPTHIRGLPYSGNIFNRLIDYSGPTFHTDSIVIRKGVLEGIGGFFDGVKIGEDRLTWLALASVTRFKCIEMPLYRNVDNHESITFNYPLHIESDEFVHNYILEEYKDRLTPTQVKRLNHIYHSLRGFNLRQVGCYFESAKHLAKAWTLDLSQTQLLKGALFSLWKGIRR